MVILPVSLWFNWRLGLLLLALIVVVGTVATFVRRRTEVLQHDVENYNTSLAERASDVLGNVPVIQSFTRIDSELAAMRSLSGTLLAAQMPVLSWWAAAVVFGRAASTITLLAIFVLGTVLYLRGIGTIGGIVMFMSFATMLIGRLDQLSNFSNSLFLQAEKLADFFRVLDTVPQVADKPGAPDPGKLAGRVAFERVTFAYPPGEGGAPETGQPMRPAVADLDIVAEPGETIALVGATGSGKSTTLALLHRAFDPARGAHHDRRHRYPRHAAGGAAPQHRGGVPGADAVRPVDRGEPAHRQARRDAGRHRPRTRAGAGRGLRRAPAAGPGDAGRRSAAARCRAASVSAWRSPARS